VLDLAAGPVAFVTHRGPYEDMGIALHALAAWIHERGHEPLGPPREIYRDDPETVAPAELTTELLQPLAR
jgi:effector-binding domain-containing protein